jgi:SAM-dependent methyltransferase
MNDVIYLSAPAVVHMEEEWFKIATLDHFWIKRRFEVLCKLTKGVEWENQKIGEVGCGHGLLQKQFEHRFGLIVDGFDLGESALQRSVAGNHPRYCYNIIDRNPDFAAAYDTLALFDVLEHIEDEKAFLEALLFHLKPGGRLLINVPAFMFLYSRYDKIVGHQRRYTLKRLEAVCAGAGLRRTAVTYWGLPWVPLLMLRKLRLAGATDPRSITQRGFTPPSWLGNFALGALGALEPLPQRILGTSLMAVYVKGTTA